MGGLLARPDLASVPPGPARGRRARRAARSASRSRTDRARPRAARRPPRADADPLRGCPSWTHHSATTSPRGAPVSASRSTRRAAGRCRLRGPASDAELGQRVPGGFHARQHGSRRLDGQEARRRREPAQVGVHHASDQWVVVLVPRTHDRGGAPIAARRPRGRTRTDATSARTGSSSRPARSAGAGRSRHRTATHCTSA